MVPVPLASLAMYDLPELRPATDALWSRIAAALRRAGIAPVPAALTRDRPLASLWRDPDLLLGQTCGAPLVRELSAHVRLVASPVYDAPGCPEPGAYTSAIVARTGGPVTALQDLAGRVVAVNDTGSHSGFFAFRASLAPLAAAPGDPVVRAVLMTGSHRASLRAVAAGDAAAAAIDAVTLALLGDIGAAEATAVHPIAWSASAPTLPFITAARRDDRTVAALAAALAEAIADPAMAPVTRSLRLAGLHPADTARYDALRPLIAAADPLGDWTDRLY